MKSRKHGARNRRSVSGSRGEACDKSWLRSAPSMLRKQKKREGCRGESNRGCGHARWVRVVGDEHTKRWEGCRVGQI